MIERSEWVMILYFHGCQLSSYFSLWKFTDKMISTEQEYRYYFYAKVKVLYRCTSSHVIHKRIPGLQLLHH